MTTLSKWTMLFLTLLLTGSPALAADQDRDKSLKQDMSQDRTKDMDRDFNEHSVYGWELMSGQERSDYRQQMQQLKTEQEREQFRIEHHQRMEERAKAQGVKLKETPMNKSKGNSMGPGSGKGTGGGGGGK